MKTIAIELNHVVRNINKQLIKYYKREFDNSLDDENIDEVKENVIDNYLHFNSKQELLQFIYEDYPYEIFGCANPIERNLPTKINNWMYNLTNFEDEEINVIYYSMNEDALTIQSTYFFLSKIGARVRMVMFPSDIKEVYNIADVIVTSNKEYSTKCPNDKKCVLIRSNGLTEKDIEENSISYDSLEDMFNDDNFLKTITSNE